MKKLSAILLAIMIFMSITVFVFADELGQTHSTILYYEYDAGDTFTFTIPDSLYITENGFDAVLTSNHGETAPTISVCGNAGNSGWRLERDATHSLAYIMKANGNAINPNQILTFDNTIHFSIEIDQQSLNFAASGTYIDSLTFTIK